MSPSVIRLRQKILPLRDVLILRAGLPLGHGLTSRAKFDRGSVVRRSIRRRFGRAWRSPHRSSGLGRSDSRSTAKSWVLVLHSRGKWGGLRGLTPQPSEPQSDCREVAFRPRGHRDAALLRETASARIDRRVVSPLLPSPKRSEPRVDGLSRRDHRGLGLGAPVEEHGQDFDDVGAPLDEQGVAENARLLAQPVDTLGECPCPTWRRSRASGRSRPRCPPRAPNCSRCPSGPRRRSAGPSSRSSRPTCFRRRRRGRPS